MLKWKLFRTLKAQRRTAGRWRPTRTPAQRSRGPCDRWVQCDFLAARAVSCWAASVRQGTKGAVQAPVDSLQMFEPSIMSTQALHAATENVGAPPGSVMFDPKATSTQQINQLTDQHVDQLTEQDSGRKAGTKNVFGYISPDLVAQEHRLQYRDVMNIYTGKIVNVPMDPKNHNGYVTMDQVKAIRDNMFLGNGIRISIEGNIGSGKVLIRRVFY